MIAPNRADVERRVQPAVSRAAHVLAACVARSIERGESQEWFLHSLLETQEHLHAICPRCGGTWKLNLVSKTYTRRIYNLARSVAFPELAQELERRLNICVSRCPRCERGGEPHDRDALR